MESSYLDYLILNRGNQKKANWQYFEKTYVKPLKEKYNVIDFNEGYRIIATSGVFNYYPKGERLSRQLPYKFVWYNCTFKGFSKLFLENIKEPKIKEYKFPFGKYKSKSIYEINDEEYLIFLINTEWLKEEVRNILIQYLEYGIAID